MFMYREEVKLRLEGKEKMSVVNEEFSKYFFYVRKTFFYLY